jgi:hypothetical protein
VEDRVGSAAGGGGPEDCTLSAAMDPPASPTSAAASDLINSPLLLVLLSLLLASAVAAAAAAALRRGSTGIFSRRQARHNRLIEPPVSRNKEWLVPAALRCVLYPVLSSLEILSEIFEDGRYRTVATPCRSGNKCAGEKVGGNDAHASSLSPASASCRNGVGREGLCIKKNTKASF